MAEIRRVDLECIACHRGVGHDLTFDPEGRPWHAQCFAERYHPSGPLRAPTALERDLWTIPLAVRIVIAIALLLVVVMFVGGCVVGLNDSLSAR